VGGARRREAIGLGYTLGHEEKKNLDFSVEEISKNGSLSTFDDIAVKGDQSVK